MTAVTSTDGPIIVSWSEISSQRACPHKHFLEYRQRWQRQPSLNSALGKGTLFHAALEAYYLARRDNLPLLDCYAAGVKLLDDKRSSLDTDSPSYFSDLEAVNTVRWMLDGYHEMYRGDSLWRIVDVEYKFKVKLPVVQKDQPELWLKGSIDLIAEDERGRLVVLDHKTCSTLPKDKTFALTDQFSLYLWALNQLGMKPFAAYHNAVKSKMNKGDIPGEIERWEAVKAAGGRAGAKPKMQLLDERFARRVISHQQYELDTIAMEAAATMTKSYLNPRLNERNPNEDYCQFMCSFKEACLEGRKFGPKWELEALQTQGFVQNFTRH